MVWLSKVGSEKSGVLMASVIIFALIVFLSDYPQLKKINRFITNKILPNASLLKNFILMLPLINSNYRPRM